jgi:general secretion pathway protein A
MYNEYFGLEETPFSIAPDPRYIYMSEQHREALAHLVYGFNSNGGFVLLTGDVGTGKTTICRCLLEQIPGDSAIAFIFNPKLTVKELLATICDEFGITYDKNTSSIKEYVDLINAFLLETHSRAVKAVLVIDEAQNLDSDVLEQLRLLTNLETSRHKLLHVILLGQPELADRLSRPELSQLSQRIIARYHLGPLKKKDIGPYVKHRLKIAGIRKQLFSQSAINKLYHFTGGVPRLINVICDRALLGAFAQEQDKISKTILSRAAHEVFGNKKGHSASRPGTAVAWSLVSVVLIVFGIAVASNYFRRNTDSSLTDVEIVEEQSFADNLDNPVWKVPDDLKRNEDTSFQTLFKLWDVDYDPENNADLCEYATGLGLKCMKGLESMQSLRSINRPAVLKLFDDDGTGFYITLLNLNDNTATVSLGGEEKTMAVKDIESRWLGEYTLLWRPPKGYEGVFSSWYEGQSVEWLRTSMAAINNISLQEPVSKVYDRDLMMEVKKFQVSQGLVPDGIVGPRTVVHINTALQSGAPTLSGSKGKN